jgi:hypothetical protein
MSHSPKLNCMGVEIRGRRYVVAVEEKFDFGSGR